MTLRSRAARRLPALALAALLAGGCGLFKPAEPERGGVREIVPIPDYSHPDSCLKYMAVGIGLKEKGQALYLGAFADGFQALVDPAVWTALHDETRPQVTDLSTEQQFYTSFVQVKPDDYVMTWEPDQGKPHDDGTVDTPPMILYRRYTVRAIRRAVGDTLLIGVGYADLTFQKISSSRWALTKWVDRYDPAIGAVPTDDNARTFGYRRLILQ